MKLTHMFLILLLIFGLFIIFHLVITHRMDEDEKESLPQNGNPLYLSTFYMPLMEMTNEVATTTEVANETDPLVTTNAIEPRVVDYTMELFPLTNIKLGMTMDELKAQYVEMDFPFPFSEERFENLKHLNTWATYGHPIESHVFWNCLGIRIEDGIIQHVFYLATPNKGENFHDMGIYDLNDQIKMNEFLFEHLKQELGPPLDRSIMNSVGNHVVIHFWKRENDWVAYAPALNPSKLLTMWGPYQVYILPEKKRIEKLYEKISDSVPDGVTLWLDLKERPLP